MPSGSKLVVRMSYLSAFPVETLEPPPQKVLPRESIETAVLRRLGEIDGMVDALMASWHSSRQVLHARRWHRFNYRKPIAITPLDDASEEPIGETMLAFGRDISRGGISFVHDKPLPCRRVAISFQLNDGTHASIVTELKWCRFTLEGHYQSGGQFLRMATLEIGEPSTWARLPRA
ncbi:MAG: hypothetical protein AB7O26_07790 [Planctomycetaceae bacterium]